MGPGPSAPAAIDGVDLCSDREAWDRFVAAQPTASCYHQFVWRHVFERAFGHQSLYLAARSAGRIVGILPVVELRSWLFGRFAVSLPFVNYGGVVAESADAADALVAKVSRLRLARGWSHVELRHTERKFPNVPVKRHKVAMWLGLPDTTEALWTGLDRKVRNQVRKAEKSGAVVESGGAELLGDFYRVFAHNMRDLGTPVYSRTFFEEVLRAFPGDARVFIVRHGADPIAASLTLTFRGTIEVPWASSLRAHNDKSPNMLLYWSMLRRATEQGCRTFDFGRSTPNEGTFHFKRQWGARPLELAWEYPGLIGKVPDQSPANPKFKAAVAIWRRLPLTVTNRLGPAIVRSIP